MLTFARRAKLKQTPTARLRSYVSEDGRYRVVEIRSTDKRYRLACRRLTSGEYPISQHRTRNAAEQACENHRRS